MTMASYDLQEQDQIEELKAWWARYGGAIATALVIGAIVVIGIQGWRWWTGKRAEDASVLYSAVSQAVSTRDGAKAKDAMRDLADRYAKMLYDSGDRKGASAQLSWVVDHSTEDELKAIARYRLAGIQIDDKQYEAALATLDAKHPAPFDGLYDDLRGDALAALGRTADARSAYQAALAKLDPKSQYRGYLQIKLESLPGAADAAGKPAATPQGGPAKP
jgi:predicted negative regulator of RcsB-dependent stress response